MTTRYVDLHIHTTFSDGAFDPREAVRYAHKKDLAAISITDHDMIDGIPPAIDEGEKLGVEVIPGVELSTELSLPEKSEMHILGYFINWKNKQFRESLALFQKSREQRAHTILEKLDRLGIRLDRDALFAATKGGAIGRLHFAKALVNGGFAASINDAFHRYLGIGRSAYVPKLRLTPEDAIKMISRTGGIAVLAHPFYGHYSNRNLLKGLVRDGLRGIEVWHSKHPPETIDLFTKLAAEFGLLATGGSDCHGEYGGEPAMMGKINV
ncbi:MAG: PHP domain-containing protein, partial [Endomicrobiales bacterium]